MRKEFVLAAVTVVSGLLGASGVANAGISLYTNQAAYLAAISAPATDTFDTLPSTSFPSPLSRVVGAYGYLAAVSTTSFFPAGGSGDVWLSTNTATDSITFGSFTGGVVGVGGNFFTTDILGVYSIGNITLSAHDANGATLTQTFVAPTTSTFIGFVSDVLLTSLSVTSVQPGNGFLWPTVNNLTLGAATAPVPLPDSFPLLATGLALLGFLAARRRQQMG